MNVAELLERMRRWEKTPAILWRDKETTYGELLEAVHLWKEDADALGTGAGRVVALEGDYSPNTLAFFLSLIEGRAVSVPLSEAQAAHREDFLEIAEAQEVFTFKAGRLSHLEHRDREVTNPLTRSLIELGEPGMILFSSGSTGMPKASLHNMSRFLAKFQRPREPFRTVAVPPMDHISGLDTLFYTLSSGGALICTHDRSPEAVCQAIESHRAELLPASATFLNLLLISEAYRRFDLSSLRIVAYGSEVMPERTLARLREVLPGCTFLQKYGMTELGSPRTRSKDDGSLWVKVDGDGFETKVVDGVLWIRAHSAMMGYLNAPSPFDEEGWFNTEDMVEVDGDYIRILGRKTEIINVGGEKVYPSEVESVLLQMDNVKDATVRGEPNPIMGNIVSALINLFEPEDPASLKKRVREFCADRLPRHKVPQKIEIADGDQHGPRFKKLRSAVGG